MPKGMTATEINTARKVVVATTTRNTEDAAAMRRIALRIAGRGYDANVVLASMVLLATEAALHANAWAEEHDARADARSAEVA